MGTKTTDVKIVEIEQGDVFFVKEPLPAGAVRRERGHRGALVAEGEATGHAHAIAEQGAEVYEKGGTLYLVVDNEIVALKHEEHRPVYIPKGEYRIGTILEYDPFLEETRKVVD